MKHKLLTITPNMAEEFLATNSHNRPLRPHVVANYANEMKCGRWQLTPQCISFLADGTLADGQHRLAAIAQSGVTLQMFAAYDLDEDAMACIDIGAKRNPADYLLLYKGVANAKCVASGIRAIVSICCRFQNIPVSPSYSMELYNEFKHELETSIVITRASKPIFKAWAFGGIAFAMKSDKDMITEFAAKIASGENLRQGDPALAFRKWIENHNNTYTQINFKAPATEVLFNCMMHYVSKSAITNPRQGRAGMDYFINKQRNVVSAIRKEVSKG